MKSTTLLLGLAALLGGANGAQADTITYEIAGIASGVLGSMSFNDVMVKIDFVSDTADAKPKSGVPYKWINDTPVGPAPTVNIAGIGTATLLFDISNQPTIFVEEGGPTHDCSSSIGCFAGISNGGAGLPLWATYNPGFWNYELKTAIGPLSGPSAFNGSVSLSTSNGALSINSALDSTFTAVPEPSSLIPVSATLLALIGVVLRGSARFMRRISRPY